MLEELGRAGRAGAVPDQLRHRDHRAARLRRATCSASWPRGSAPLRSLVPWSTAPDGELPTRAGATGTGSPAPSRVSPGALEADVLLVLAAAGDGLPCTPSPRPRATVTPLVSLDMTRQLADVTLDGAPGQVVLARRRRRRPARARGGRSAAGLRAARPGPLVPGDDVAYLKERRQFGRVLGGFQALKHRLADLYTGVESGRGRGPLRRRDAGGGRPGRVRRRLGRSGLLQRSGGACRRGGRAAARRHRHDLGAPRAPLPQARQVRPDRARHAGPAPRPPRDSWSTCRR